MSFALDALLRAIAAIVALAPRRAREALGAAIGWLAGSVLRIRRAHVERAMARAAIARGEAAGMYASLGVGVAELLALAGGADEASRVRFDGASRVRWDEARKAGRGLVVAASHTGNWELTACALAREVELVAVVKRQGVGGFERFTRRMRASRGVVAVSPEGALARARAALARGGVVAMVVDQVPVACRHAVRAPFLGADAYVDRAPAALAARAGAPLVVAASRRDGSSHTIEVLGVIVPPARAGRAWVERATRDATALLDRFVRAHPRDWLWLHRRWRAPFDAAAEARTRDDTAPQATMLAPP